jgi:hypothetical protein
MVSKHDCAQSAAAQASVDAAAFPRQSLIDCVSNILRGHCENRSHLDTISGVDLGAIKRLVRA